MGGLLMIAVLPAASGLSGRSFDGPAFAEGYETAMRICALLALASAVVAVATIRATASERASHTANPHEG
jgi:hypothetical protein